MHPSTVAKGRRLRRIGSGGVGILPITEANSISHMLSNALCSHHSLPHKQHISHFHSHSFPQPQAAPASFAFLPFLLPIVKTLLNRLSFAHRSLSFSSLRAVSSSLLGLTTLTTSLATSSSTWTVTWGVSLDLGGTGGGLSSEAWGNAFVMTCKRISQPAKSGVEAVG